jgi:hypothetical protein
LFCRACKQRAAAAPFTTMLIRDIFMFPVTVQAVVRKRTRNLCFDAHNLHFSGTRHTFDNFRQLHGSEIDSLKVICHFGDFNLDEYVGVAL